LGYILGVFFTNSSGHPDFSEEWKKVWGIICKKIIQAERSGTLCSRVARFFFGDTYQSRGKYTN
jgi:hypothetical protein